MEALREMWEGEHRIIMNWCTLNKGKNKKAKASLKKVAAVDEVHME